MKTSWQYYRVDRRKISFIKFIFEAYEGLAIVTTIDAATGMVVLRVAPGCEIMAREVMQDLGKKIHIESIDPVMVEEIIRSKEVD